MHLLLLASSLMVTLLSLSPSWSNNIYSIKPLSHIFLCAARVITDRETGRSKGFGFVTYATVQDAEKAKEGMNAKFLDGWVIFVDPARPREPRRPLHQDQPQSSSSGSGFTTNKTIGWCKWTQKQKKKATLLHYFSLYQMKKKKQLLQIYLFLRQSDHAIG